MDRTTLGLSAHPPRLLDAEIWRAVRRRRTPRLGLAAAAAVLAVTACSSGESAEIPEPVGDVTDLADVLDEDQEQELAEVIRDGNESTDAARVAVLTEPEVSGDIEDRARDVASQWGVGEAGEDNGILVLLAVEDQEVRMEVADGAREHVTDEAAEAIVDDVMVPAFQDEAYAEGLTEGTRAIYQTASGQRGPAAEAAQDSRNTVIWVAVIIGGAAVVIGLISLILGLVRGRRKRTAQELLMAAYSEDTDLQLTDRQERDYIRWAKGRKVKDISPVAVWLPLYVQAPHSYGAVPPPSPTDAGMGSSSSFGGGGGFTGGGATGRW